MRLILYWIFRKPKYVDHMTLSFRMCRVFIVATNSQICPFDLNAKIMLFHFCHSHHSTMSLRLHFYHSLLFYFVFWGVFCCCFFLFVFLFYVGVNMADSESFDDKPTCKCDSVRLRWSVAVKWIDSGWYRPESDVTRWLVERSVSKPYPSMPMEADKHVAWAG